MKTLVSARVSSGTAEYIEHTSQESRNIVPVVERHTRWLEFQYSPGNPCVPVNLRVRSVAVHSKQESRLNFTVKQSGKKRCATAAKVTENPCRLEISCS